jgi:hypothetical protein
MALRMGMLQAFPSVGVGGEEVVASGEEAEGEAAEGAARPPTSSMLDRPSRSRRRWLRHRDGPHVV